MRIQKLTATALVATMATALLLAPATAFHNPGIPQYASVAYDGNHWAAWRITTTQTGTVEVEAQGAFVDTNTGNLGVWLLDGAGNLRGACVLTLFFGGITRTYVQVLDEEHTLVDTREGAGAGFSGISCGFGGIEPGEHIALAMAATDGSVTGGQLNLYGEAGATVTASTEGTETFAGREPDFVGTVNTYVEHPAGVQAKVIVDASYTQEAQGRMFALFNMISNSNVFTLGAPVLCAINIEGPVGGAAPAFISNGPPGSYAFNIPDCVDGGIGPFKSFIWVMGGDVTLP